MPPRRLPFSSLLNVRSKKVLLPEPIGDSERWEGLMLMSAVALAEVVGDPGEESELNIGASVARLLLESAQKRK